LYLPPGFAGRQFPLPRATREAFSSLLPIFSQLQRVGIKKEIG
jgi:hypothetical protein